MPIPLGILAVAGAGAAGGGSYELIESVILTGTATDATFSNIPQTYKHLQLRIVARADALSEMYIRFNGNSSTIYSDHYLRGTGSAVQASGQGTQSSSNIGRMPSEHFSGSVLDILDYANTSKNKTTRNLNGMANPAITQIILTSGSWQNTAAITSITIFINNTIQIGSRFSLYGIKG